MGIKVKRDYVQECLSLRDATAAELAILSPDGRPKRVHERMRRAGQALMMNEGLAEQMKGKTLRVILFECEKAIAGIEFDYRG